VPLILSEATLLLIITLPSTLFSKTLFTLQIFSKPLSLTSLKLSLIYPTVFSKLYLSQLVTLSITKIILNFSKASRAVCTLPKNSKTCINPNRCNNIYNNRDIYIIIVSPIILSLFHIGNYTLTSIDASITISIMTASSNILNLFHVENWKYY